MNSNNSIRVHARNLRTAIAGHGAQLNIELARGEIAVLLGRSDAEKTAWLETLAALRPAAAGKLQVLDYDTTRLSREERTRVLRQSAYLSADAPLLSTFDVRSNVMLPHLYHFNLEPSRARDVADQLLDRLGYEGPRAALPAELDLFETWQVLLARGLALDPPVLFIDEPFELHVTVHWPEIEKQLQQLARDENRTVVVATQNLRFARTADWIVHVEPEEVQVFHGWAEVESSPAPKVDRFLRVTPIAAAGESAL